MFFLALPRLLFCFTYSFFFNFQQLFIVVDYIQQINIKLYNLKKLKQDISSFLMNAKNITLPITNRKNPVAKNVI